MPARPGPESAGEATATPRPWQRRAFPDDWDYGGPGRCSSRSWFIGTDDDAVAVVVYDTEYRLHGKGDAKARLIVAAPEVVACLRELIAIYRDEEKGGVPRPVADQPHCIQRAMSVLATIDARTQESGL